LHICRDFEILILEDERIVCSVEEYFTSILTPDLQVEMITWDSDCVIEYSLLGRVLSYLCVREWLLVRKCESFIVDISDLELEFIVIVESKDHLQVSNNWILDIINESSTRDP
jgi:hypothetical protein